jgi:hypothetical protein
MSLAGHDIAAASPTEAPKADRTNALLPISSQISSLDACASPGVDADSIGRISGGVAIRAAYYADVAPS